MKKFLAGTLLALLISGYGAGIWSQSAAAAALPAPLYRYTDTFIVGNSGYSQANAITTNAAGDVFIAGDFNGTINFAGQHGNDTITSSDITSYLTKYNADGSYGWTRIFDTDTGNGSTDAKGLAIDSSGNIYMTGTFSGGVTFGGSDSAAITGTGTFLSKFSAAGTYDWTKTIIPPGNGNVTAVGIALDTNDDAYIGGYFNDIVNFAGSSGTDNKTDAGGSGNTFITKFSNGGVYDWTQTMDTAGGGRARAAGIAFGSNHIYINGYFEGTVDFDGSAGSDTRTSTSSDSFVSSFAPDGSYVWSAVTAASAGINNASGTGIATDTDGNVYSIGAYAGSVNFAGNSGSDVQSQSGFSYGTFLTKYGSNGSYNWTKSTIAGSGGSSFGVAVATDILNNVYVLSGYNGPVDFNPAGGDTLNYPNDLAVSMYSGDGSYNWSRTFDTTNGSLNNTYSAATLTADRLGNIYIASDFMNTVNFDPAGAGDTLTSASATAFMTSYQTFDLSTGGGVVDPSAPSQLPQPPNTGLKVVGTPLPMLLLGIGILAIVYKYIIPKMF